MSDEKPMGQVIQIDEARIRDHLGEMVRGTVEETLNAMLDAEADGLCGAGRYERNEARQDTRAGSYDRTLQTSAGEVSEGSETAAPDLRDCDHRTLPRRGATEQIHHVYGVGHEAAVGDERTERVDSGQPVPRRQRNDKLAMNNCRRAAAAGSRSGPQMLRWPARCQRCCERVR